MSIDRDPATLIDINNACQLILEFVSGRSEDDFSSDMLLQSAVLHQLLVLGEAVRRLTDAYQVAHPEIEWSGYIGLRNVLIHRYDEVDLAEIWKIATSDVPALSQRISVLLPDVEA